jgi:hypothetical protein
MANLLIWIRLTERCMRGGNVVRVHLKIPKHERHVSIIIISINRRCSVAVAAASVIGLGLTQACSVSTSHSLLPPLPTIKFKSAEPAEKDEPATRDDDACSHEVEDRAAASPHDFFGAFCPLYLLFIFYEQSSLSRA